VIVLRLITALFTLFVLLPLLWLVYAAFIPPEALINASLVTPGFSLENIAALPGSGLGRAMLVSLTATGTVVTLQLTTGLTAAYAARAGLPLTALVLVLLAVPTELLLVPLYRLLQGLQLIDTFGALTLPFAASPLVVFLLMSAVKRVPWSLVEAARLDGANEGVIVARVVAPVVRPELLATGVLAFAAHWNLVLYPRVMTTENLWTVQAFLTDLLRTRPFEWGLLGAAALVASLPILILYVLFERRIVTVFERGFRA
jgi:multiple sugar transport system permease protein